MRDWMHYLDRTFEGKSGDAIFVGVSFVAGGLNIWGCIPMSVIWGFGMLGGSGGLIITCRQKTSTLRLDIEIFYLELFVWEPPIPIFVSIVPHFLHIFIRHLSGEILHDVDKVLLHSIQFQIQSCNVILSAKIIGTMGHCTARYLSQKVCWRVIGMRLELTWTWAWQLQCHMYLLNPMFVKFVLFSSKIGWEGISSTKNLVNIQMKVIIKSP